MATVSPRASLAAWGPIHVPPQPHRLSHPGWPSLFPVSFQVFGSNWPHGGGTPASHPPRHRREQAVTPLWGPSGTAGGQVRGDKAGGGVLGIALRERGGGAGVGAVGGSCLSFPIAGRGRVQRPAAATRGQYVPVSPLSPDVRPPPTPPRCAGPPLIYRAPRCDAPGPAGTADPSGVPGAGDIRVTFLEAGGGHKQPHVAPWSPWEVWGYSPPPNRSAPPPPQ